MVALDGGVIETSPGEQQEQRLAAIHKTRSELIEWHRAKGGGDRGPVSSASNVALGDGGRPGLRRRPAGRRASAASSCFTYTPQAIKKAVCGSGAAGKGQVQRMVGILLGLARAAGAGSRRRRVCGGDLPRRRAARRGTDFGRSGMSRRPSRPRSPGRLAESDRMIASVRGESRSPPGPRRASTPAASATGSAVSSETLEGACRRPGSEGQPARRDDRARGFDAASTALPPRRSAICSCSSSR